MLSQCTGATQLTEEPASNGIIQFWFSAETRPHWFLVSDAFDARVRERFGALAELASAGDLDDWAKTPEGSLALLLRRNCPAAQPI
ncbi:MAG: DUF924 family protein [Rhodomicrobium sp.]